MSVKEWMLWRLRHRRTRAGLTLRSAIHQLIKHCVALGRIYPEIPVGIVSRTDVDRLWLDPEHKFMLLPIRDWMWDLDSIVRQYHETGELSDADVKSIVDAELPTAKWGGGVAGITTYSTTKPEIRGLLLAATVIRAEDRTDSPFDRQDRGLGTGRGLERLRANTTVRRVAAYYGFIAEVAGVPPNSGLQGTEPRAYFRERRRLRRTRSRP